MVTWLLLQESNFPPNSMELEAKLYLNGFPKSGTHALESLGSLMLPRLTKKNWMGNVESHAFTTSFANVDIEQSLDDFLPRRFCRGHMAYTKDIADAFQRNKICKVFIFRDFRDVATSTVFHVLNSKHPFPNKEFYETLEFEEVLQRVITGDHYIAGIMDRWEMFAPWLDEDWVLKISYEDFIEHREGIANLFFRYLYGKTASYNGYGVEIDPVDYEREVTRLIAMMEHPETSITFRKGKIGDWENYFTEEHKDLLKEADKNNWLTRLGYTNDRNW